MGMASRQRSFFDQKPSSTYSCRPWYHRQNGPDRRQGNPEQRIEKAVQLPAIAASSQARRKLSRYRCQAEQEVMQQWKKASQEKENMAPLRSKSERTSQDKASSKPSSISPLPRPQEFPQTPIARVPLADLVDNGTVLRTNSSPTRTPPVHISWKQSPTSSDSESAWTEYRNRKKRKRAHSNSPDQLSSQRSLHFDKTFLMPPAGGQGLLDPASQVEHRLFGTRPPVNLGMNLMATPCKAKVTSSASAELMRSSSPTTPGNALTESAKLRRTRSCGVAFPGSGSRKKRRKELGREVDNSIEAPFDDRLAKISALLDMVDGDLPQERRSPQLSGADAIRNERTRASEALDQSQGDVRFGEQVDHRKSRRKGLFPSQVEAPSDTNIPALQEANELSQTAASLCIKRSGSSEFGDEFDADILGIADDPIESRLTQPPSARQQPDPEAEIHVGAVPHQASHERKLNYALDEFLDDDDDDENDFMNDLTAADLEQLAATYDEDAPDPSQLRLDHSEVQHVQQARVPPDTKKDHEQISQARVEEAIDISSDGEFGGDDFADIAEEFGELTQAVENKASATSKPILIPRYFVKNVLDGTYLAPSGFTRGEKIVQLQEQRTKSPKIVHLREAWLDSVCPVGATVHVIGTFSPKGSLVVDNSENLLVVHPDHLLSATVVADAFKCARRAVLQDRVKATSEVNESQVFGHILHEVFQESLKANRWDAAWLETTMRSVADHFLGSLFELNLPVDRAVQEMMNKLEGIQTWAELFVARKAKPGAQLKGPQDTAQGIGISKLLDVEEHVWSPLYGLKGNIDATVQVHAPDSKNGDRQLVVPFELKTGRATNNTSHNSQTALYTLLLSDRYDVQIAFGILYYLETNNMTQILGQRKDIIHMIMKRNELANYIRGRKELPPMLKNEFSCSRCYAQTSCFVYHKLAEEGDGKSSGMGEKFKELMGHLDQRHAAFFKNWEELLTKEEGDVLKFRGELWSMLSSEREKIGRCFGGLVIKPGKLADQSSAQKINRFQYTMVKKKSAPSVSFAESQINLGEPIVISDEAGHYALANGYVTRIRPHEITIAVDRKLHNARSRMSGFDEDSNQSYKGIMEVRLESENLVPSTPRDPEPEVVYRLDKDEFSNGMALVRNNLIRMMEKDLFGARPLRRLVVEDVAPSFRPEQELSNISNTQCSLNVDQRKAISKVMAANEYALVLGMPGTGKTTTISHIIKALVAEGKSVLLASYTHTAVDNILLKIRDENISILRIGTETKIHPEIQDFADLACRPKHSFEDIKKSYQSQVVATTCLGINHPIFNQRTFDYCIVDEASQITLPVCVGPIRMAHRFVLVGDHYQLPPLVQNKEAREGGLDISLFKLLSDRHPESMVLLEHQYRMCADIMSLSNTLIYNGMLKCGTEAVATRQLSIPEFDALQKHHHSLATLGSTQTAPCPSSQHPSCWLRNVLDPDRRVVFLNTDSIGGSAGEIVTGSRVTNPFEVSLVTQLVRSLVTVGICSSDIGVITLYRSQLSLLRQSLRPHNAGGTQRDDLSRLEMHTADKFQGRDKEAVVLSLVRSNDKNTIGDLLQDWRRVNVALTRARTKLIIVGSFSTMKKGSDLLEKMCSLIDEHNWRIDVHPRALEEHWFDEGISQTLEPAGTRSKPSSPAKAGKGRGSLKEPLKRGKRMSPARILKSRPILQDIVNEAIGYCE